MDAAKTIYVGVFLEKKFLANVVKCWCFADRASQYIYLSI